MTREEIVNVINQHRQKFNPQIEEKKGIRFFDDDRVIRRLRMDFFHEEDLSRLPTINEFIEKVSHSFLHGNVMNALREQASLDYNYMDKEKWS